MENVNQPLKQRQGKATQWGSEPSFCQKWFEVGDLLYIVKTWHRQQQRQRETKTTQGHDEYKHKATP